MGNTVIKNAQMTCTPNQIIIQSSGLEMLWIAALFLLLAYAVYWFWVKQNALTIEEFANLKSEAHSPEAVKGHLLWRILVERRVAVTVRVKEGKIQVIDPTSEEHISLGEYADPGRFENTVDVQTFLEELRKESGHLRRCSNRVVPVSASPPQTYAYMIVREPKQGEIEVRVIYDVPRWRWIIRKYFWDLGLIRPLARSRFSHSKMIVA